MTEYSRDATGTGIFCGSCVKVAVAHLKIMNAEGYVEGVEEP